MSNIPPGIYRIVLAEPDHVGNEYLSRMNQGDRVTVLPPGAVPGTDQLWRVSKGSNGDIIIESPALVIPSTYLTYRGDPEKPEQGNQIQTRRSEFPPNEWRAVIVPGAGGVILTVAGSDFGINFAPIPVYPPILELSAGKKSLWAFNRIGE